MLGEFKYNVDTFEKTKQGIVNFYEDIQLMHINSSKFLACHDKESKLEKENYEITLDDYSSDNTQFKIIPAYKYQKDGNLVVYEG